MLWWFYLVMALILIAPVIVGIFTYNSLRRLTKRTLMTHPRMKKTINVALSTIAAFIVLLVGSSIFLDKGTDGGGQFPLIRFRFGQLKNALDMFRLRNSRYPTTNEGLQILLENTSDLKKWGGPYIEPENILDPWGRPFKYRNTSPKAFEVISFGPDGVEGTDDDFHYPPPVN